MREKDQQLCVAKKTYAQTFYIASGRLGGGGGVEGGSLMLVVVSSQCNQRPLGSTVEEKQLKY